jgi:hypothetical protein
MNTRRRISPLAAMALIGAILAQAPEDEQRAAPPPERRPPPPPPKPPSGNAFHDHLDVCAQCRNNPFGLCAVGAATLERAAIGIDYGHGQDESVETTFQGGRVVAQRKVSSSARTATETAAEEKRDRKRAARLAKAGAT